MKQIKYVILVMALALSITSCEKKLTTADVTDRIIQYPTITIIGSADSIRDAGGSAYKDPGATALLNGDTVPVTKSILSANYHLDSVNVNVIDIYNIKYTAYSAEGYPYSVTRKLTIVPPTGDLIHSISGTYSSTVVRDGVSSAQYTNMKPIYIIPGKVAGEYSISDAVGGYYDIGRKYGPAYAAKGLIITAVDIPTNNFTFNNPIGVGAFGGNLTVHDMTVDKTTKTIHFIADWSVGHKFDVTLTQQ